MLNPVDGTFYIPPDLLVYTQEFLAPAATPAKVQRLPYGIVPPPPVDLFDIHDGECISSTESRTADKILTSCNLDRSDELAIVLERDGLSTVWEGVESREMGLLDVHFLFGEPKLRL